MKVLRITSLDEFVSLADEWDDLLEKSGQANVFLTHEWMLSWWKVYGAGADLFILACRSVENRSLVGILPLYRKPEGYFPRVNILRFIAGNNVGSDFLEPIYLPDECQNIFKTFIEYLQNNLKEWDVVEFSSVELNSIFYSFLNSKKNILSIYFSENTQLCPYVSLPKSWEELLASVSKKVRQKVGYYRRSLERHGSYEIYRIADKSKLNESITNLMHIRKQRLESKGINFDKVSDNYRKFHTSVMENFLEKGWLQLCFLKFQNKPVAFVYQFVFQRRVFFYQTGFDKELSALSVGFVLLGHVIEDAIRDKNNCFEFLRGDEKYKYDWNVSKIRQIVDICIVKCSIRGKIFKFKISAFIILKNMFREYRKLIKSK